MELGTFTPYYNQLYLITSHTWVLEAIFDGGIHVINSGVRNLPFTYHPCVCCIWLAIVIFGGLQIEILEQLEIGYKIVDGWAL